MHVCTRLPQLSLDLHLIATSFKDAAATIRRTSTDFHYQLVIQRAYEEGEEQLVDDAEDADDTKDEKTFLLDESLHLRSTIRKGQAVFAWRDLSGVSDSRTAGSPLAS